MERKIVVAIEEVIANSIPKMTKAIAQAHHSYSVPLREAAEAFKKTDTDHVLPGHHTDVPADVSSPNRTGPHPNASGDAVSATATLSSLKVIGTGFSASERGAAEVLAAQGRSVVLREASGVGRTSDLLLDGVPYDVYSPKTGKLDRIVSAIASKGSQVNGGGVVLDLGESPLTGVDAAALLARVQGVTSNISDIIILGG